VGERLAALALAQTYGMKGYEARAPQYRSHTVENGRIVMKFDNIVDDITPWHDQPVKGFEIAGEDRVFYPDEASKWQLKITVWSDKVKNPVAVRYMFHNFGEVGNVKNMYGVPLAPFRTDNWNDVK
jgi:sialate O-acetylesterase